MKIINLVENSLGDSGCQNEHGLSFYIETEKHKLLVDSGASDLFLHNAEKLGIDLSQVDICILSHGHFDHAGGLLTFAQVNPTAKIYMKSSAGGAYYHVKKDGEDYIGIDPQIMSLEQCVMVDGDLQIDEELYLYTDISAVKYPAKGNLQLMKKTDGGFVRDTFDHEQCLVITEGDRKVLLSGCAHNGILNILDRYEEIFHDEPDVVISGFHLIQPEAYAEDEIENIKNIAHALAETKPVYYTGHCTGPEAYDIMKDIMGGKLQPIHSGDVLL
jgi:7,8-dihydropterin-6-yl-methyl-4-(beta-D-ribofuranosyl)aminobenzene 5'-phosphate synthase